jgi:arsenite methyltransferase
MTSPSPDFVRASVRDAYAAVAQSGASCCAPSCCAPASAPVPSTDSLAMGYSPAELAAVPEGANLGLGCGNPVALASLRPGEDVLDLGSGPGFDCLLASRAVGTAGSVVGVDMTPAMLDRARETARSAGATNVRFLLGTIEALPVPDQSVDVILSNCVINLSPEKDAVLREAFRALRPGGRLAIKDVLATAPIPDDLQADFAALAGCVAGAATVAEIEQGLRSAGFEGIHVVVDEASREMVDAWLPGRGAGAVVASASITALRPERR